MKRSHDAELFSYRLYSQQQARQMRCWERENQSRIWRKEFIWSHAIIDKRKSSLFLWAHLFFVSLNEISIRLDGAVNQRSILSITNGSLLLTWDRLTHAILLRVIKYFKVSLRPRNFKYPNTAIKVEISQHFPNYSKMMTS